MNIRRTLRSKVGNFLFTKEHEWVSIDDDIAIIGITDFAQNELGDIIFIELPKIGEKFEVNDVFGTIEAVKTVADLYMPLSGEIIEINEQIDDNPECVNNSPYDKGWIIKININDSKEINNLLTHQKYKEMING